MATETRQAILACIDEIVSVLGQKDYEAFRAKVSSGSTLLTNMGTWAAVFAALSYDELAPFIDQHSEDEQQRVLRLMVGLKEYLPMIGLAVSAAAKIFPPAEGGRPMALKGREKEREACELIWHRIRLGDTEPEAKRYAARKFKVSARTMHRTWKRRPQLLAEKSFEEFFGNFLKGLSAPEPLQPTNGVGSPIEPVPDTPPSEGAL